MLLYVILNARRIVLREYDKRIFTGEGNHFPQNLKSSPLRESRKTVRL